MPSIFFILKVVQKIAEKKKGSFLATAFNNSQHNLQIVLTGGEEVPEWQYYYESDNLDKDYPKIGHLLSSAEGNV